MLGGAGGSARPDPRQLLRALLPPGFPPDADPETYRLAEVNRLLRRAAYFPLFSIPDPGSPNRPIPLSPLLPQALVAVEVHEQLHRFAIAPRPPGRRGRITASNDVGEAAAAVHIRWTPMADDFEAGPGRVPPPTLLNPFRSQRFTMLDGELRFGDRARSGFHGFLQRLGPRCRYVTVWLAPEQPAAICLGITGSGRLSVNAMHTVPELRKRGAARAALHALAAHALEDGCPELILLVESENTAARPASSKSGDSDAGNAS